jgi:hypothetical protein
MSPIPPRLEIQRSRPECPPPLQLLRVHAAERAPDTALQAHLDGCERCRADLQALATEGAAARVEPIPAYLSAGSERPRLFWPGVWAAAAAGALAVVLAVVVSPRRADEVPYDGAKGGVELLLTVARNGTYVYESAPPDAVKLQDGDRLRLRIAGAEGRWVIVRLGAEGEPPLFAGVLGAEGYIDAGLRYTSAAPSRVDVVVCASQPASPTDEAACTHRTFSL